MHITDLFGNTIEVTDLTGALNQANAGQAVSSSTRPFSIDAKGMSWDIKGRENESIPMFEYWKDMHSKLSQLN